jgi:ribonuclease Z
MNEDEDRARETGHSTAADAARIAAEANVKMLALVHISSRYHVRAALDEAREVFENSHAPRDFDLIDLPFPEKGEPVLIPGGAVRGDQGSSDRVGDADGAEAVDSPAD